MRPKLGDTFVRRDKGRFTGRLNEKRHFEESVKKTINLSKDLSSDRPEEYTYPHVFLVVGLGGIGKTALSKQFIDISQSNKMKSIYLDCGDDLISDEDGLMRALYDKFIEAMPHSEKHLKGYRDALEKRVKARRKVDEEKVAEKNAEYQSFVNVGAATIGSFTGPLQPVTTELIKAATPKAARLVAGLFDDASEFANSLLKRGKIDDEEHKLFTNQYAIAEKFFDGLHEIGLNNPLVIVIDTYERIEIVGQIDEWLRHTIYQLGSPYVLWVIAGRENERFLDRHNSAGSTQIEQIRLRELSHIDISSYLKLRDIYPDNDQTRNWLASILQSISRGVPLAIEALADMHNQGIDIASYFEDIVNHQLAHAKVVQILTERFLKWCDEKTARTDNERVLRHRHRFWIEALAMLTKYDRQALRHLITEIENDSDPDPDKLLEELGNHYSFIFSYETNEMHDMVREVIRENWHRKNTHITDRLHRLIVATSKYYTEQKEDIEQRFNKNPQKYVVDREWQEITIGLLNSKFWMDEYGNQGIQTFIPLAIEIYFFGSEFLNQYLTIIKEFVGISSQNIAIYQEWLQIAREASDSETLSENFISIWNQLYKQLDSLNLTSDSKAIVLLMKSQTHIHEKAYAKALDILQVSIKEFNSKSSKLKRKLAHLVSDVSYELSQHEDINNLELALRASEDAINLLPNDWYCHYTLGKIQNLTGNSEQAFTAFQNALNLVPENPLVLHEIGNYYGERDQDVEAIKIFDSIVEKHPKLFIGYLDLGAYYDSTRKYDKSVEILTTGIENCPDNTIIYFALGNTLYRMNKYNEALQAYETVIKNNSEFISAYIKIAEIQDRRNKFEDAKVSLELAINIDETAEEPRIALGKLYFSRSMYKQAQNEFRLLSEKFNSYDALLWQGRVYRELEEYRQAFEMFEKAQRLEPQNIDAMRDIADTYRAKEQYDTAIKVLEKLLGQNPNSVDTIQQLADLYYIKSEADKALDLIHHALELEPKNINLKISQINYYRSKGDYQSAYMISIEIVEIDSYYTAGWAKLGELALLLGNEVKTREVLASLLLSEADETIYELAADYYVRIKDYSSALKNLEMALELKHDANVLITKGLIHSYLGEFDLAIDCYLTEAKRNSRTFVIEYNLAVIEAKKDQKNARKKIEAVRKTLKKISESKGIAESARGYYGLGGLAALERNTEQAITYLDRAINLDISVRSYAINDIAWENLRENPQFNKLIKYEL